MKKRLGLQILSVLALSLAINAQAKVEYHLNKVDNPSADELDAYEQISAAMDSAVYLYNKYTHLSKHIEVYYNTGVQTADASYNGTMRFGSNRSYMRVRTAMHEMGHTMGMGTTSDYSAMLKDGVFQGQTAQAKLKELTGDPDAVLKGDNQHFWPYGLNYDSELHSEEDLIIHCQIVEAMYQDIFKEAFYLKARVRSLTDDKCIGITASNGLEMTDCTGESTISNIWSVGDNPKTYRFEFGERVIDIPNESTAAGVVAGTYYWNAGAHQKYLLEVTPVNKLNAFYLKNSKSNLYLLPSGKNIVQDERSRDMESGIWILEEIVDGGASAGGDTLDVVIPTDPSAADTAVAGPSGKDTSKVDSAQAIAVRNFERAKARILQPTSQKFDAKGRAVNVARKPKYFKLF